MMRATAEQLGALIRTRRRTLGLTQAALALAVGHDRGWLAHVEHGRRDLAIADVRPLAERLGLSPLELLP